jgi:sporulation protein YhbH|tara:strand:+ start:5871 stop:7037 length:1167 start_codon:yes stop_codon:yes gene_type:complete
MSIFRRHKTIADRSAGDRARHRKKIEKAIKEGIHNIVAEESIIGKDGKKKFKIPVRGIKEYRFVYGDNGSRRVGSAQGKDVSRGQKIGEKEKKGQGKPDKPGQEQGEEFYEVELTLEQLADYLFRDLELPNFEQKRNAQVLAKKIKRKGYRPQGIRPRLDKKKTVIQKLKRKNKAKLSGKISEDEEEFSFHEKDLRYKHFKVTEKKSSNAAVFFLMDISGSMTRQKKFLARSFFFLLYHFIRSKYDKVEVTFISHDVEAYEVNEEQFFGRGSAGGTLVSSALKKTDDIINARYHKSSWNTYIFQCSDGDNWPTDNTLCLDTITSLLNKIQFFGYCEIEPNDERLKWISETTLSKLYEDILSDKFKMAGIYGKDDIWIAFKKFFKGDIT